MLVPPQAITLMSSEELRDTSETFRRTRGNSSKDRDHSLPTRNPGARDGSQDRSTAPNSRSHSAKKANGHANGSANHAAAAERANGAAIRANGHGRAFESVPEATAPLLPDAASDGARVNPNAAAAHSAVAGMVRDAHAEAAEGSAGASGAGASLRRAPAVNGKTRHSPQNGEQSLSEGTASRVPSEITKPASAAAAVHGGEAPLPEDPTDFVQEVHRRVDLFDLWISKLNSKDEKISQRALEKITDMLYKGAAASPDEQPQPILIDIDSAVARRARGEFE